MYPLAIRQCCTHGPGVKFAIFHACTCKRYLQACMPGFPSGYCHNKGPNCTPPPRRGWGAGLYCPRDSDKREPKHRGGHQGCPDPFPGRPTDFISPRRAGVITHHHHQRGGVARFTVLLRRCPRGPHTHQFCRPQHHHTSIHQEQ